MTMISTADAATAAEAPTELGVSHAELESQRNAAAAATGQIAGRHSRITGGMGDRNLAGVRSNDGEWNLVPRRMFKRLSGSRLVRLTHSCPARTAQAFPGRSAIQQRQKCFIFQWGLTDTLSATAQPPIVDLSFGRQRGAAQSPTGPVERCDLESLERCIVVWLCTDRDAGKHHR